MFKFRVFLATCLFFAALFSVQSHAMGVKHELNSNQSSYSHVVNVEPVVLEFKASREPDDPGFYLSEPLIPGVPLSTVDPADHVDVLEGVLGRVQQDERHEACLDALV